MAALTPWCLRGSSLRNVAVKRECSCDVVAEHPLHSRCAGALSQLALPALLEDHTAALAITVDDFIGAERGHLNDQQLGSEEAMKYDWLILLPHHIGQARKSNVSGGS